MKREVICVKDLMIITGKSKRTAWTLYDKIKKELGKKKYQYLTVEEVSKYLGISETIIHRLLE